MITVTTHEAKIHLSKLLKKVREGEEVIIRRGDIPVARLVPIDVPVKKQRPSVGKVLPLR